MRTNTMLNITIDTLFNANNVKLSDIIGNTDITSKGFKAFTGFINRYYNAISGNAETINELNKKIRVNNIVINNDDTPDETKKALETMNRKYESERYELNERANNIIVKGNDALPNYLYAGYVKAIRENTPDAINTYKLCIAVWLYKTYEIKTNVSAINTTDALLNGFTMTDKALSGTATLATKGIMFNKFSKDKFNKYFVRNIANYLLSNNFMKPFDHTKYVEKLKADKKKN